MYHIIINPIAGKDKAAKNLFALEDIFCKRGVEYTVHKSTAPHEATEIARTLTTQGETELIVVGGDGTLHEVLNGIVDTSKCRLGLIPSGTGNDFAEGVGIPFEVEKAAALILENRAKATNYLQIGDLRCMNIAGLGIDVDVLERCNRGKKGGKAKYLKSLMQSMFCYKGTEVVVESEEHTQKHFALIAAACNGTQFGGGIRICPEACADDDKLNVVIVDYINKWKIIAAFIKLLKGKILQYPLTKHYLCDRVKFTTETPCTVQLDGELYKDVVFDVCIGHGLQFYRP